VNEPAQLPAIDGVLVGGAAVLPPPPPHPKKVNATKIPLMKISGFIAYLLKLKIRVVDFKLSKI
jgi:hypothetical protein